ncbi:3-hydroxyacyl-CoA dehydrogenase/enoyl-CoA hydratase family protein [Cohnella cellulosilytica]|uniref:3-hydroxyacyl-CoA dehydrogenase/enoyl-CoA hydratase family protein n=1 Tax=Cohnella cellulosilytica TaxID=986710 RepID=A0ABW2FL23_9BACL
MWNVRKAAVIGAGETGASIAAHLANAGIPCLLLDREGRAADGLARLKGTQPPPLYDSAFIGRIRVGDMERDFAQLAECDWIIEAVSEELDVKRGVWSCLDEAWKPGMIVSSSTSGLSIDEIAAGCGDGLRKHAMVTHFFNPPRYLKLVEIVPGRDTDRQAVEAAALFCRDRLGKGVVEARNTPNFIANRIGAYALLAALAAMEKHGLTIDETEAVTGPVLGRPESATFGTLDRIGLDTFLQLCRSVRENVPDPMEAAAFAAPPLVERLAERGWLGEKSGGGFFRREESAQGEARVRVLDPRTMAYVPRSKAASHALEAAKRADEGTAGKVRALLEAAERDRLGAFVRDVVDDTLIYAAEKLGEIADTPIEIDRAMRWGFNWEEGPFELWDALGVAETAARLEARGRAVPAPVAAMLEKGTTSFYLNKAGSLFYYSHGYYKYVEEKPEEISLKVQRARGRTIFAEDGTELIDLGDDVACLEFRSRHSALGPGALAAVRRSAEEVERNWRGLVLANEGRDFGVGANLRLLLMEAENGEWAEIDLLIRELQASVRALRRLPRPVVAAPRGKTLGVGAELCMPADRILFATETYFGLDETGIGLIPAGGGCLAAAALARERADEAGLDDATQPLTRLFESIAMAKVSESGHDAKRLGYWRGGDAVLMRDETRIYEAKNAVLELERRGYAVPESERRVAVGGRETAAVLKVAVSVMRRGGFMTEHDARVAGKLAEVLTGGSVPAGTAVSEQSLFDLEREAFLSLCGEPLTQARMRHALLTGKRLRN